MRIASSAVLVLALASGCGCGDNGGSVTDAGPVDAPADSAPDASPVRCPVPDIGAVGGFCADDDGCAAIGSLTPICLDNTLSVPWPAGGFCTVFECVSSADCPEGTVCGQLPAAGGTFGACLPECCEGVEAGDVCSEGRVCSNTMFGDDLGVAACVPATLGVGDGAPCMTFGECDLDSTCRDDPFQQPGGQCAVLGCASDDDCAPGGDGRCVNLPEDEVGNVCVDDCAGDGDCRTDEGYRCIDHGAELGKFCRHPAPGDTCSAAADCGTGAASDPWVCRQQSAAHDYPGGYCTVEACEVGNPASCPIFSFCVELTGEGDTFCADECEQGSGSCGAGYECVEVNVADQHFACLPAGAAVVSP